MKVGGFGRYYKKLTADQRRAVDNIDGPVMVIAGPGTGKTTVLALRIANILRLTDTKPDQVLTLTFTDSGVESIRTKLVDIVGDAAYRLRVHTFHSFANELISHYPSEFDRILGSEHMTDVDQVDIIEGILKNGRYRSLRPSGNPYYYVAPIISAIKELKREDISPASLTRLLAATISREPRGRLRSRTKPPLSQSTDLRSVRNTKEFDRLYREYERQLHIRKLYDYEDMLTETIRSLRQSKDFLLDIQEQFLYILADEHQDANQSQNHMLELLSSFHPSPNLFVVGDEKQAIFRFQGASLENFEYFRKLYPGALLIPLTISFRSPQPLLDASHTLMKGSGLPSSHIRLTSRRTRSYAVPSIRIIETPTLDDERQYIAKVVSKLLQSGVEPGEIAILYRNNHDADLVKSALREFGIQTVIHGETSVFDDPEIENVLLVLRAIDQYGNAPLIARTLLLPYWNLDRIDIFSACDRARERRTPLAHLLTDKKGLAEAGVRNPEAIIGIMKTLSELSHTATSRRLVETIELVLKRIHFSYTLVTDMNAIDRIPVIRSFLNEIENITERHHSYRLRDFLIHIETMRRHGLIAKSSQIPRGRDRVHLMTAHKAKGLEFGYIFVFSVVEGHWGGRRNPQHFSIPGIQRVQNADDEDNEDRKLLYVAITRAKQLATVSYHTRSLSGRSRRPARYIEELKIPVVKVESSVAKTLKVHDFRKTELKAPLADTEYLRSQFLAHGLSVSALNNYLNCPWRYFFVNLVRIPQFESPHQLYGSAIHTTLRDLAESVRKGTPLRLRRLITTFLNHLSRTHLSDNDFLLYKRRGVDAISSYFRASSKSISPQSLSEYKIHGVTMQTIINTRQNVVFTITGILDRIDLNADGTVDVIDYKTGSPKSRNEIEGKTFSSNGDMKRQLVFYRLILERHDPSRFRFRRGIIEFIEPTKSGQRRSEAFDISEREVADLEALIRKVAIEIYALSFWNRRCEDKLCEHCALAAVMKGGLTN